MAKSKRPTKPASVKSDPWRSKKWDEITRGRSFDQADAPMLALLVQWYQVVEQCMEDITANGGVRVVYGNDLGDIKALPQLSTMKQATAEIRALNKQLGIADGRDVGKPEPEQKPKNNVLQLVIGEHNRRAAGS